MFALPDDDAAEAAAASATHRISAIQLGAAQAFVNTAGLKKLRERDPLTAFDSTPAGWDQFAQHWHEVTDLNLLGVPPAMHPRVLMRCLSASLRKNVAGWVRDDPTMSLDQVFDQLRQDFQIADAYGDAHNWESLDAGCSKRQTHVGRSGHLEARMETAKSTSGRQHSSPRL